MARFRKDKKGAIPPISTASMPDIIFMLLFFFMVSTTLRDTTLKVKVVNPYATEIKKLEKKSLVSFIYVGKPSDTEKYGTAPRIQLNDAFATTDQIREFISSEREKMTEIDRNKMSVSLKADGNVDMGIITDVKQELRRASALKLNYASRKGTQKAIFENLR
ncbi:MAG: biopolymer transporter ExbD [Bacteroidales bacterium]|nr:biopolymer transporter ExbD [Bacteroidales bacterium]